MANNRSELVAYSRLVNNPKIKLPELVEQVLVPPEEVRGKEVLVIQDTTEFNYHDHINYLDLSDGELGPTVKDDNMGFFVHPGMVVDVETGISLGYSYFKIWNRSIGKLSKAQRNYQSLPIEEKESFRWIECAQKSKDHLSEAKHITILADRESDIYDEFVRVPDTKTDLIIRSKEDRLIVDEKERLLYPLLGNKKPQGQINIQLNKAQNKDRTKRVAKLDVVATQVRIKRSRNHINKNLPDYVDLYAVQAIENNPPKGQEAICWRLLTTIEAETFEMAVRIIELYCLRWQIELLFLTVKTGGIDLESSQVETGKALKVLCVLGFYVSLKIVQLKQAREDQTGVSASIVFSKEELIVLEVLCKKYEGKTEKQKNHYKRKTLAWASWVIGRIGGWKGYASEAKPGIKTMREGLFTFYRLYDGFMLAKICA
jgi:hypothetical protein